MSMRHELSYIISNRPICSPLVLSESKGKETLGRKGVGFAPRKLFLPKLLLFGVVEPPKDPLSASRPSYPPLPRRFLFFFSPLLLELLFLDFDSRSVCSSATRCRISPLVSDVPNSSLSFICLIRVRPLVFLLVCTIPISD